MIGDCTIHLPYTIWHHIQSPYHNDLLRYFAGFDDDGRYTLKCQVTGDDYTDVNGGFLNENRLRTLAHYKNGMRTVQGSSPVLPICCGSDTVNANTVRIPTGGFERPATGGSFKVFI